MFNTQSDVIEILSAIFYDYHGEIHKGLTKDDFEDWNSLATAQIIMALESRFNKHFTDEEIASINSVDDIIRLVSDGE
jgi:acyl carrier protein